MTNDSKSGIYERYFKRVIDIILSGGFILIFSWVYLILAFFVGRNLGRPVLFIQLRPGKDEKIFRMFKFRSMTNAKDAEGNLLPDADRLPPFGEKLRSTSLDELPELFNILKGDMSIVGPRPQLVRDMVFMTDEQRRRHSVRQGLTGLAQVSGRNGIDWDARLKLDVEYVDNITFIGDMKIIFKTVKAVFIKEGVQTEGMATSEDLGDYLLRLGRVSEEEYQEKQAEAKMHIEKSEM